MKVFCTLTREQATLYEAVVKEATDDIGAATEEHRAQGRVLAAADAAQAGLQPPGAVPRRPLAAAGPLGQAGPPDRDARGGAGGRASARWSSPSSRRWAACCSSHLQETFGREVLFLHGGVPRGQRDRMVERFQNDADAPPVFVLSLKAGGTGPQPDARQPRLPLRPLVEPGRRGPGHRPRLPHRPDAQRAGAQVRLRRHAGGDASTR